MAAHQFPFRQDVVPYARTYRNESLACEPPPFPLFNKPEAHAEWEPVHLLTASAPVFPLVFA